MSENVVEKLERLEKELKREAPGYPLTCRISWGKPVCTIQADELINALPLLLNLYREAKDFGNECGYCGRKGLDAEAVRIARAWDEAVGPCPECGPFVEALAALEEEEPTP